MPFKHIYLIAIAFSVCLSITIITTYFLSRSSGHVLPPFPFISDTGSWPPESCIFSFACNICAFFALFVGYFRYLQIGQLEKNDQLNENGGQKNTRKSPVKLNLITLVCMLCATAGLVIIGCFQEVHVASVHALGGLFCYFGATSYIVLETAISYKLLPTFGGIKMVLLKALCAIISSVLYPVFIVSTCVLMLKFKGSDITKWQVKDGGEPFHSIATLTEWSLTLLIIVYVALIGWDLKKLAIFEPKVLVEANRSDIAIATVS